LLQPGTAKCTGCDFQVFNALTKSLLSVTDVLPPTKSADGAAIAGKLLHKIAVVTIAENIIAELIGWIDLDKEVSFMVVKCSKRFSELVESSLGLVLDQSTKRDADSRIERLRQRMNLLRGLLRCIHNSLGERLRITK
jgi:hypothetical protein